MKFKKTFAANRCSVETGSVPLQEIEVLATNTFALVCPPLALTPNTPLGMSGAGHRNEVGKAETHNRAVQSYPCGWHS
jgi:hypothetical protein